MKRFVMLLLCSVALAQGNPKTPKPEVIKAPEEGLIRAEKMTDAEFDDLWLAKQALEAIKNKIAAAHNMSVNYGWRNGWYINGEMCTNDFEIRDKFLLYSQHCTPLVVNTYWTTQPLGTPNFYFTTTSP